MQVPKNRDLFNQTALFHIFENNPIMDILFTKEHQLDYRSYSTPTVLTHSHSQWASQPDECIEGGLDAKTHLP